MAPGFQPQKNIVIVFSNHNPLPFLSSPSSSETHPIIRNTSQHTGSFNLPSYTIVRQDHSIEHWKLLFSWAFFFVFVWMKIEAGFVDRKRQGNCQLPKEMSRSGKKNRRRQKKSMTVVQELFETCRNVFSASGAGIVPSPGDVERIRLVLDSLKPDDVGLSQEMPYFRTEESDKAPPVTYLHVYECDKFSIGIFCLPPSAVIPLHNHPGMTVFSKLLFGSMHIKSYDWADISCSSDKTLNPSHCTFENLEVQLAGKRLAKVKTDALFTAPCNTSILYPAEGGNMHRFTAKTSCAVLDVLGPPYSDPEGRHCTYYRDFSYASISVDKELGYEGEGFAWLEEKEKLEDFSVLGAPYRGPKIVEN